MIALALLTVMLSSADGPAAPAPAPIVPAPLVGPVAPPDDAATSAAIARSIRRSSTSCDGGRIPLGAIRSSKDAPRSAGRPSLVNNATALPKSPDATNTEYRPLEPRAFST